MTDKDKGAKASAFLMACRREPAAFTPVWLMRQAGRYMKEYRELRSKVGFKELCRSPELAAQVTVDAAARLGTDAAIIFSDLLLLAEPMGFPVNYPKEGGPVIEKVIRDGADVESMRQADPKESLGFVMEAIRITRENLPANVPLIGFAGAPYTLASYLIEGRVARDCARTKAFMMADPGAFFALLERISSAATEFLNCQIEAGAQAVQIFDSWVGTLSPADYRRYVLPHTQRLIRGIRAGTPVIHFGTQTAGLLELMSEAGGDVIGLDWRVNLDEAWARIPGRAVMGNLDPAVLLGSLPLIRERVGRIISQAQGKPGHIFNLGHGVLPETPVENAKAVVDLVHEMSRKS